MELYEYQKDAINFIEQNKSTLVLLKPGLGKTVVAAEFLKRHADRKAIVICPKSLLVHWKRVVDPSVVVTNYERMPASGKYDIIIFDESIRIKNRHTQLFNRAKSLVRSAKPEFIVLLSGNPVSRWIDDIWSQLNLLRPERFRSYWSFTQRFCIVHIDQYGWHIIGNQVGAFHKLLREASDTIFFRDISLEKPVIVPIEVPLPASVEKIYHQLEAMLSPTDRVQNVLTKLIRMKQLCAEPEMLGLQLPNAKVQTYEDILTYAEKPVVVFSEFPGVLDKLGIPVIDGSVKTAERQRLVDAFNAGEIQILGFTSAARFGFSIFARTLIFWSPTFDRDSWIQSIHRAIRANFNNQLTVYVMLAKLNSGNESIDEIAFDRCIKKGIPIFKAYWRTE